MVMIFPCMEKNLMKAFKSMFKNRVTRKSILEHFPEKDKKIIYSKVSKALRTLGYINT